MQAQGQDMGKICCGDWGYLAILLFSKLESEKPKPSLKILDVEILENNT
jgi:hypothetical protein